MQYNNIRNFINANKNKFKQGSVFSEDMVLRFFQIEKPDFKGLDYQGILKAAQNVQMKKVAAQNKINKVLAKRGLYMSQSDRVNYRIRTADQVQAKIKGIEKSIKAKKNTQKQLKLGLKNHKAKWSHVLNVELPES